MRISEAAKQSGVSAKTIRYYESVGLIPAASRGENGYRSYSGDDVHMLRFIHRARDLGFPVEDVSKLLALWQDKRRASADVKALALRQVEQVEEKIRSLKAIRQTLRNLAEECHGDKRSACPIIEELAIDQKGR